ncbi:MULTISPECIES: hypothetical protein [Cupriavidus]
MRTSPTPEAVLAPATAGKSVSTPKRSLHERILEAQTMASRWLADGNEANERGHREKAEQCYAKSQYWLDRAILLEGRGDRPPPKR